MRARVSSTACFQNRVVTTSRSRKRTRRRCSRNKTPGDDGQAREKRDDAKVG